MQKYVLLLQVLGQFSFVVLWQPLKRNTQEPECMRSIQAIPILQQLINKIKLSMKYIDLVLLCMTDITHMTFSHFKLNNEILAQKEQKYPKNFKL